jgi:hypothetical protein
MSGTCPTVAHHLRIHSQTIQALYTTIPTFPEFPMQAQVLENSESWGHGRNMSGARTIMTYNPLSISQIPLVPSTPYIQNHTLSLDFTTIPWVLGLCLKTQNLRISECGLLDFYPKTRKLGLWPYSLGISGSHYPRPRARYIITYSPSSQNPDPSLGPTTTLQV